MSSSRGSRPSRGHRSRRRCIRNRHGDPPGHQRGGLRLSRVRCFAWSERVRKPAAVQPSGTIVFIAASVVCRGLPWLAHCGLVGAL